MVSLSFRMLCWLGHVVEPRFSVSPKLTLPMSFLRDYSSSRVLFIYIIVMPWQLKNTGFAGCFQNHHSGHPHDSVLYDYFFLVRHIKNQLVKKLRIYNVYINTVCPSLNGT